MVVSTERNDGVEYLAVGMGGFLGANTRYLVTVWAAERIGATFPYGTMLINVTGSFVIGLFLFAFGERILQYPYYRLFFATGFLGAYTTFSTFSFDTLILMQQQNWAGVAVNIGASVGLGLLGVIAGAVLGRLIW